MPLIPYKRICSLYVPFRGAPQLGKNPAKVMRTKAIPETTPDLAKTTAPCQAFCTRAPRPCTSLAQHRPGSLRAFLCCQRDRRFNPGAFYHPQTRETVSCRGFGDPHLLTVSKVLGPAALQRWRISPWRRGNRKCCDSLPV